MRYRHCFKLFRELRKESEKVGISVITLLKFLLTETNCGNVIVEIGKKKILWQLWQCHCQKWEEKKLVAKIWGGIKKKSATSTIFLQHFHNKSQVISCY